MLINIERGSAEILMMPVELIACRRKLDMLSQL